jgi:hypothetical protein
MKPQYYLYPYAGELYLGMVVYHGKQVSDVTLTPEVSANLANWSADWLWSEVTDFGSVERIITLEWDPISALPKHFMRLRLDRH